MSVEYRITETNETTTRGNGGVPTGSERAYTVEAVGGPGNYKDASLAFFQWALSRHACDPWGNPIVDDGIELVENPDSLGWLWNGRIRWEFPSAVVASASDAYEAQGDEAGDGSSSSSEPIQWYPFISSFSIAGGTKHMSASLGTRAYPINAQTAPDFGGGIGWDGEGFEGVDVPCPAISFDVTARTPQGFVANFAAFLGRILSYVGTVNATNFYGCAPGTVLFNGITSGALRQGTSSTGQRFSYWEMTFNFSAMPNAIVNVDGHAVPKSGWEYLWNLADDKGNIKATYVETVFQSTDFRGLGLGGNF